MSVEKKRARGKRKRAATEEEDVKPSDFIVCRSRVKGELARAVAYEDEEEEEQV